MIRALHFAETSAAVVPFRALAACIGIKSKVAGNTRAVLNRIAPRPAFRIDRAWHVASAARAVRVFGAGHTVRPQQRGFRWNRLIVPRDALAVCPIVAPRWAV